MKQAADDARQHGQKHIPPAALKPRLADYDHWIFKGLKVHPEVAKPAGKRGRAKQSKERNLLMRMSEKRDEVRRFAQDLDVPFDNNPAERDLRMNQVQQKVSGCFRSYLSTTRKHGLNLMDSIKSAFAGQPVDFAPE